MIPATTAQHEVALTREFDAPREVVFAAWTDAEQMKRWSFQPDMAHEILKWDARPGGELFYWMDIGDGEKTYMKSTILELSGPARFVFVDSFADENGKAQRAGFDANWPEEMMNSVTISTSDKGGSIVSAHITPRNASDEEHERFAAMSDDFRKCWEDMFVRLDEHLAELNVSADAPILELTHLFGVPAADVFKSFTQKQYVEQWTCPMGYPMRLNRLDARPGGELHYAIEMPDGPPVWMRQDFIEVTPARRLTFTFAFSDEEGEKKAAPFSPVFPREIHYAMTFGESDGKGYVQLRAYPLRATEEGRKAFAEGIPMFKQSWESTFDMVNTILVTEARSGK